MYGTDADRREKRYVEVECRYSADGVVTPLVIVWDSGVRYHVDKVLDVRQAHSLKTGGTGMRYAIRVGGKETFLWFDDYRKRWFVEARVPVTERR